jgi:predicted DNA-binding protein (UPF0251 family)
MRMGRPPRHRRVGFIPQITYFKPAGIPLRTLEEICLSVEEAEAIRLKDLEGLGQGECAGKMNISRTTFQRLLGSARQKIAHALLKGKAIRIEGGNFEVAMRRFRCDNGHEWDVPFEVLVGEPLQACPTCSNPNVAPLGTPRFGWDGGGKHRGGRPGW